MTLALRTGATLLLALPAAAQDWPNWRGPNHDGSSPATGLPATFDKQTNVRWAAALPGPGASTPIVVGTHVYTTSVDELAGALLTLCHDRETGEELWVRAAPAKGATRLDSRSNYAAPSVSADAERAVSFFGNGDLVCYDPGGETLWARNLQEDYGPFQFQWTFSTSPTLYEGRVYVMLLQRDEPVHDRGEEDKPSFLLAFDAQSGELAFEHVRPAPAKRESRESYATPIPYVGEGGRAELLVVGGDVITGHSPEDGAELWRWGTWNEDHREQWWRVVPSPVVGAGKALVCAPKGAPVIAVELGGEGELSDEAVAWKIDGRRNPVSSDVPTPLFYDGAFFVLGDLTGTLSRVDPADGRVAWTIELPGRARWRASPTGADGRIYLMNHAGLVVVIDPASGEVLHQAEMGEEDDDQIRSTVAVAHSCLFLRTNSRLYCVGATAEK
jgi:outer membrane protein assembly factor BamB